MIYFASGYKKKILTEEQWEALKDLICDPYIKDVMGIIKKTYNEFCVMAQNGKVSAEEQQIVKTQVADCNKMLTAAINELIQEGRLEVNNNTKNRKLFDIKDENEVLTK